MTVEVGLGLLALTGLIACVSWLLQSRLPAGMVTPPDAIALAGWAGLSALAGLLAFLLLDPTHPLVLGLLAVAAAAVVRAVVVPARAATREPGPLVGSASSRPGTPLAAAEATIIGCTAAAVFWVVLAGSPAAPPGRALAALALLTVDVVTLAFVGRLPSVPGAPGYDRRHWRAVRVGVGALVALTLADAALTLGAVGSDVLGGLGPLLRALACGLAGVVPWLPSVARPAECPADRPVERPVERPAGRRDGGWRAWLPGRVRVVRALPNALVTLAVSVQLFDAFRQPVGPVPLGLVAIAVGGLVVVQRLARRENARLRRDLDASRTRLHALLENAGDVILAVDATGTVVSASGAAPRLLHRTAETMGGLDVAELTVVTDRPRLRQVVEDVVHGRRSAGRVELRLAAPATGTAELRLRGVAGGAVVNISDVTDAVELRERLERMARYDEMTGLPNRAHLMDEIDGWLRTDHTVSVLYADLDGFKAVNDRFGHQRGDDVLVEAARRLRLAILGHPAERVLVARMGGDEFVVALLGARPEHVTLTTERLLAGMRPTFNVHDRAVRVGLSVGVAASDDAVPDGPDPGASALLHRADVAMFAAKQAGRFRAIHWDAAMEARAQRRVDIAIGLRRALDRRRLALAYQPLVRLADGAVIGVEALIRVSGDDHGPGALSGLPDLVTPAELVAVAEDTGEIVELGQWVLTEATAQAARWRAEGHDIFVAVNVSVRQLEGAGFVGSVVAALHRAQLPSDGLVVEITEGQLLSEADPAWGTVERLRRLGVALVIDDFGSGYSSLSYLRRLPVRAVKLDRGLLDDLTTDPRARTLARAVVSAARALGLLVVAEGLESLEAARIVRDLGAYAGQGFALGQALPAEDVARLLAGPVSLGGPRSTVPPSRRTESLTGPVPPAPPTSASTTAAPTTPTKPEPTRPGRPSQPASPAGPRVGVPAPPTPRSIDLSETDVRRTAGTGP